MSCEVKKAYSPTESKQCFQNWQLSETNFSISPPLCTNFALNIAEKSSYTWDICENKQAETDFRRAHWTSAVFDLQLLELAFAVQSIHQELPDRPWHTITSLKFLGNTAEVPRSHSERGTLACLQQTKRQERDIHEYNTLGEFGVHWSSVGHKRAKKRE